jgi:hypothetical protein
MDRAGEKLSFSRKTVTPAVMKSGRIVTKIDKDSSEY